MRAPAGVRWMIAAALLLGGIVWHNASADPVAMVPGASNFDRKVVVSVCRVCGSRKSETSYGEQASRTGSETSNSRSPAHADLLDGRHEHDWAFEFSSSYHSEGWFFAPSECVVHADAFPLREGRAPNRLATRYNESEHFRAALQSRLASGEFDRARLIELLLADEVDESLVRGLEAH